jgi:hypothetical protein
MQRIFCHPQETDSKPDIHLNQKTAECCCGSASWRAKLVLLASEHWLPTAKLAETCKAEANVVTMVLTRVWDPSLDS